MGIPGINEGAQPIGRERGRQSIGGALAEVRKTSYRGRTMKTRLSLLLGLLIAVTPASVAAQSDTAPLPEAADPTLVEQICEATSADATELSACIDSVGSALAQMVEEVPQEEQTLLDQIASTVDDTLDDLRDVDIEGAFNDVLESAQEFDVDEALAGAQEAVDQAISDAQTAIDELELPSDIDVQGALEDAVAEALTTTEEFDFEAAVNDALAEAQTAIDEADLQGTVDEAVAALGDAVAEAQVIVTESQAWAMENRTAVCRGGSISLGTTVGVAVFVLTGVEWLGLQAFWATERFTNGVCGDVVGDE